MSTHEDYYWTAGDDWQIDAKLIDLNGVPFDLGGTPDIRWSLMTEAGDTVLTEADVEIVVTDAPGGLCEIQIPAAKTGPLAEGRYTDMIRIVYLGITSTLAHGLNWVTADPWAA
jgi:hypothetical protein